MPHYYNTNPALRTGLPLDFVSLSCTLLKKLHDSHSIQKLFKFLSFHQNSIAILYVKIFVWVLLNKCPQLSLTNMIVFGSFFNSQRISTPDWDVHFFCLINNICMRVGPPSVMMFPPIQWLKRPSCPRLFVYIPRQTKKEQKKIEILKKNFSK